MLFSAHCSWLCKTILTLYSELYLSRLCYSSPVADPAFELRRGPALIFFSQPAFLPSVISIFFFHPKLGGCPPTSSPPPVPRPTPRSATAVNPLQDVLVISTVVGIEHFFVDLQLLKTVWLVCSITQSKINIITIQ